MENPILIKKQISVIGAGRVGQSLASALSKKKYTIGGLSCRDLANAQKAVTFLGQGYASHNDVGAVGDSEIVFITTPDDTIEEVVEELERGNLYWKGRVVFHCSGVLSSAILSSLKQAGAATASLHPLQSLPGPQNAEQALRDIFFSLEGDEKACRVGEDIAKVLGSQVIYIKPEVKAFYHTAAAIASNYLTSLLAISSKIMGKAGISLRQAENALLPLMEGTLSNIKHFGVSQSLTGPICRGDEKTVALHLNALKKVNPEVEKLYRLLGIEALKIAESQGLLSADKKSRILKLLQSSD